MDEDQNVEYDVIITIREAEAKGEAREGVTVEILVPYGGPYKGLDRQGDYFTSDTNFSVLELPDTPRPVVYFHGLADKEPESLGTAVSFRDAPEGRWYTAVLDTSKAIVQQCLESMKAGKLRASSQAIASFVRRVSDAVGNKITHWPLVELTLVDERDNRLRAVNPFATVQPAYAQKALASVGLDYSGGQADTSGESVQQSNDEAGDNSVDNLGDKKMTDEVSNAGVSAEEIQSLVSSAINSAFDQREAEMKAKQEADEAEAQRIAAAVEAERAKWEADFAKSQRLPGGGDSAYIAKFGNLRKYDDLDTSDLSLMVSILGDAKRSNISRDGYSENALKALAVRIVEDETSVGIAAQREMKAMEMPMKANEINQSTLTSYGDEWAGMAFSQQLWESIRDMSLVASKIPSVEIPAGTESLTIPTESGDPTWYKVPQIADLNGTTGRPDAGVTSSKPGTGSKTISTAKMGCRTLWSGEVEEDLLIPWLPELKRKIQLSGAERMDHVVIDGDTATGATTNINDIAGTPASTDLFLLMNGFRKLALVTNTANSRDGGTLAIEDFLETMKLMGTVGKNANQQFCAFILDPNVYYTAMALPEVKTQDVFSKPTIENGLLTAIYGYPVYRSYNMHYASSGLTSYEYKTNAAGKIDVDTASNNTKGAILAVRWDQWLIGWKRRMQIKVNEYPEADAYQLTAYARFGMVSRDNEASAISYNITV